MVHHLKILPEYSQPILDDLYAENRHYRAYLQAIVDEGCGAETLVALAREALDRATQRDWVRDPKKGGHEQLGESSSVFTHLCQRSGLGH